MHLLVLSAFRHDYNSIYPSVMLVSMHLLVLSAFRLNIVAKFFKTLVKRLNAPFGAQCFPTSTGRGIAPSPPWSQCTFWCSVLSDANVPLLDVFVQSLNAPFGAQCFPTYGRRHRRHGGSGLNAPFGAQCFPTRTKAGKAKAAESQCTFWCSVLSDRLPTPKSCGMRVSMHLLVLSAFRPSRSAMGGRDSKRVSMHLLVLSAFRHTSGRDCLTLLMSVSMHLLVLSAFRREVKAEAQRWS